MQPLANKRYNALEPRAAKYSDAALYTASKRIAAFDAWLAGYASALQDIRNVEIAGGYLGIQQWLDARRSDASYT